MKELPPARAVGGSGGLAATEIGDAVHRLLEEVDLAAPHIAPDFEQVRIWYPSVTEEELGRIATVGEWELSLSFGVSVHDGSEDPAALLRSADDAMYEMKRKRNVLSTIEAADDANVDAVA